MEATLDLVCGMHVGADNRQFFSDYNEHTYRFCSSQCKRKFDDHPDFFIQKQAKEDLGL